MTRVVLAAFLFGIVVSESALACSVCFGAAGDKMTEGLVAGIYLLLGITVFVLSCFVAFIIHLWKRGRTA